MPTILACGGVRHLGDCPRLSTAQWVARVVGAVTGLLAGARQGFAQARWLQGAYWAHGLGCAGRKAPPLAIGARRGRATRLDAKNRPAAYNGRLCISLTGRTSMPIYAYKCTACGYARDVLQKMSDPLLTICPECKAEQFVKQVTAAGFQLKGSGWYATDFKGGGAPAPAAGPAEPAPGATSDKPAPAAGDSGKSATPAPAPTAAATPAASSATPSPKAD